VKSTEDVVEFLKEQHKSIKTLFAETLNAPDNTKREKAFNELRKLLAVHETAEEMVVHPRARQENNAGTAVVEARLAEENKAKKHLEKIEHMEIGSTEFMAAVKELQAAVIDHAEHEEQEEFSKLARNIAAD
jgi:hemerythrin superfamily protein